MPGGYNGYTRDADEDQGGRGDDRDRDDVNDRRRRALAEVLDERD